MVRFRAGEEVVYQSSKTGRRFPAIVADHKVYRGKIEIRVASDPFPVSVYVSQLTRQKGDEVAPTPTRSPAMRRLAKEAKLLGIRGWQRMKPETLKAAVAEAKGGGEESAPTKSVPAKRGPGRPRKATAPVRKARGRPRKVVSDDVEEEAPVKRGPGRPRKTTTATTTKRGPGRPRKSTTATKATVTKRATKKATANVAYNGDNPFRPGSNIHTMTEELLKGGTREAMIRRLKKSVQITPWSERGQSIDVDSAIDKRLMITAGMLEKDHGFTISKEGRGTSGTLQVVPPKSRRK